MYEINISEFIYSAITGFLIFFGLFILFYGYQIIIQELKKIHRRKSDKEQRNFKIGIPLGLVLGILSHLPHFVSMVGGEQQWWFIFVQLDPIILFVTILFIYACSKFLVMFFIIPKLSSKIAFMDGVLASFVLIQIIVFLKFPLIFVPLI